jgi:RNA chaperone Hfq
MKDDSPQEQDAFLNAMRSDGTSVSVYLVNGIRLVGQVQSFDRQMVLISSQTGVQLVYKHAYRRSSRSLREFTRSQLNSLRRLHRTRRCALRLWSHASGALRQQSEGRFTKGLLSPSSSGSSSYTSRRDRLVHTTSGAKQQLFRTMNEYTASLPSVVRRNAAGQMLIDGASLDEVASKLGLSMPTVRRYRTLVNEGGLEALETLSVGGRKSILEQPMHEAIALALHGTPKAHGFDKDNWTTGLLRTFIEQKAGVRFSRVYVWQIANNLGLGHRLAGHKR